MGYRWYSRDTWVAGWVSQDSCARSIFSRRMAIVSVAARNSKPRCAIYARRSRPALFFSVRSDVAPRKACRPTSQIRTGPTSQIRTAVRGRTANQGSARAPSSPYSYYTKTSVPKSLGFSGLMGGPLFRQGRNDSPPIMGWISAKVQ